MTRTAKAPSRSRFYGRAEIVARALFARRSARVRPLSPARILIAHHLLLGDTLMLTPLIAKLRAVHPHAEIAMTVARAIAPLYATRPYGVRALPWDTRAVQPALFAEAAFDLAIVPGDNRYAWLAAAMQARWIVAHDGDTPARKNWPVDERVAFAAQPGAWGDIVAQLVDGAAPPPYRVSDWIAPPAAAFERPTGRHAVLHVGASSPLKQWAPERWRTLAAWLEQHGIEPVWSAGAGERELVRACDPGGRHRSFAGELDLAQLWHLLAGSTLLVAPDTGIAHLGRIVGVPTVALFGPGSALLCGAGLFWRGAPYRAVTVPDWPCRDQRILFRREIDWVRRCGRSVAQCPAPACMAAIEIDPVLSAIRDLGVLR